MTPKDFAKVAERLKSLAHPFEEGRRQIEFIDDLVRMGEEPYEIEATVRNAAEVNAFLFFGWLMDHGQSAAPEVLMQMVEALFEHVYLVERPRRATLAAAGKPLLEEFIQLVEFVVSDGEWRRGANPFDGLLNFYRYLQAIGYQADLPRRERAVAARRRKLPKAPCASHQKGLELTQ